MQQPNSSDCCIVSRVLRNETPFVRRNSASVRREVVAIHHIQEEKCSKNGMTDGNKMCPADHSN